MTSASRLGHHTSGHEEETIRLGLTEAEAETLGVILQRITGPNGKGGPASRRVHADRILDALRGVATFTTKDEDESVSGVVIFIQDEDYDTPLEPASEDVVFL